MIIDSHCHYNLMPIADGWQQHWTEAQAAGVSDAVVVGTSVESSQFALYLANKQPHFFPTIGLHPYLIEEIFQNASDPDSIQSQIDSWLVRISHMAKLPAAVAVGEIGLDYFRLADNANKDQIIALQKSMLQAQLQVAATLQKPVILHVRDTGDAAYQDTLNMVRDAHLSAPFILHCVSGPINYIQEALKLGAYVGVAGNVTYKSAEHIRDLVRSVPKDRLLLETDAPYLPPHPHRGKLCVPDMIAITAEFIKNELHIEADQCAENTRLLFQLPIR